MGIWSGDGTAAAKGCILSGLRNFCLLWLIKFSGSPNLIASSFHNCMNDKMYKLQVKKLINLVNLIGAFTN